MFSEASVSHSVQGGMGFPACITDHMTGGSASRGGLYSVKGVRIQEGGGLLPGGEGSASRGVGQTPPPLEVHGILWNTVNKRVVRILLKCILVLYIITTLV